MMPLLVRPPPGVDGVVRVGDGEPTGESGTGEDATGDRGAGPRPGLLLPLPPAERAAAAG